MISAILLDFDGTLAAFEGDFGGLLDGLRTELGLLHCDFESFRSLVAARLSLDGPLTLASALEHVHAELGVRVPEDLPGVVERACRDYGAQVGLRAGALELLEALAATRLPLGLASNGPEDMQRAAIAVTGVARFFRTVLISGDRDVGARKPHPRIFGLACTGLESLPRETLMVGDNLEVDVAGANAYGMPAVLLRSTTGSGPGGEERRTHLRPGATAAPPPLLPSPPPAGEWLSLPDLDRLRHHLLAWLEEDGR